MNVLNSSRFILSLLIAVHLYGCKRQHEKNSAHESPESIEATSSKVDVNAGDHGFRPSIIRAKKGAPLTLVFKRTTENTCATEVVFPELKLEKKLPLNQPVDVIVPTDSPRELTFQCGMAMYKSKVAIE